jgi:hypothetical protein
MPKRDRILGAFFSAVAVPALLAGACATATTGGIPTDNGTGGSNDQGGSPGGGNMTWTGGGPSGGNPAGGNLSGGTSNPSGGQATGGATGWTGGTAPASGGKATGGATGPTGGISNPTGGTSVALTGGTSAATGGTGTALSGGAPAATGGSAPASGGVATATGGGPANSVSLQAGGYYQMSTTYFGYCFTSSDKAGSTITPPCGTGNPCFTPATGVCASGTIAVNDTSYSKWGIAVGCNIAQPTNSTGNPPTTTLSPTLTVHVTLSANAGSTLPTSLRIQVGDGSGTEATTYCGTLTLSGGTGSVVLSSLKTKCWDTTGTAFTATTPVANVQVQALSNTTATQPFNFCISALTIS